MIAECSQESIDKGRAVGSLCEPICFDTWRRLLQVVDSYLRIAPGLFCALAVQGGLLPRYYPVALRLLVLRSRGCIRRLTTYWPDCLALRSPKLEQPSDSRPSAFQAMQQAETTAWNIFAQLSHLCRPETRSIFWMMSVH